MDWMYLTFWFAVTAVTLWDLRRTQLVSQGMLRDVADSAARIEQSAERIEQTAERIAQMTAEVLRRTPER